MGKFDEIRKVMKDFKADMDGLVSRKIEETDTAKARLNPTALKEELRSLDAEYGKHFEFTRNMYKEKLNDAITDKRKGNANKYITGYIDYDLLNKMNIISQSGVQLEEAELADFCKEAMKSRSEFCVRKVQLMAKANHFSLAVPSEAKANSVLDKVSRTANNVIGEYTGKLTGCDRGNGSDGHSMMIKVEACGHFLDRFEQQYERETVEDIKISRVSKERFAEFEADKKEREENKPVEMVEVSDSIGVQAKPESSNSSAEQYARKLSQKMAGTVDE